MPLINVFGILLLAAFLYWLADHYAPANPIIQILKIVIVVAVVLFLFNLFFPGLSQIRVGR